jgi:hypothetical protein
MAKLTAAKRKQIPSSEFAGPDRSYPVDTRNRAVNAKGRADQQFEAGHISSSQYQRIVDKANKALKK